jgi:hypothetical protein
MQIRLTFPRADDSEHISVPSSSSSKHVFVGVGERRAAGNRLRYYALV